MLYRQEYAFFIFAIFAAIFIPALKLKKIGWFNMVCWQLLLLWCSCFAFQPFWIDSKGFAKFPLSVGPHFIKTTSAQILALAYILPIIAIEIGAKIRRWFWVAIVVFMTVDMTGLQLFKLIGKGKNLMDATTFDASIALMAGTYCLFKKASVVWFSFAVVLIGTALMLGEKTTLLCAGAGLGTFLIVFNYKIFGLRASFYVFSAHVAAVLLAAYQYTETVRWQGMRPFMWWFHIEKMKPLHWIFGVAPGSFKWNGFATPIEKTAEDPRLVRYVLMHGDYAQMFYEYGLLAFVFLVFAGVTLYRLRANECYLVIGVMFLTCMLTYFPLHFPIPLLMTMLILNKANELRTLK